LLSWTPRDAGGNTSNNQFGFRNEGNKDYSHADLGPDQKRNPYLLDIEKAFDLYIKNHPMEFK
jgi:hypothetical protein